MIKKCGGAPRPFKERGRKPVSKSYQNAMRKRAWDGRGHNTLGEPKTTLSSDADDQNSRSLFWGYKPHKRGYRSRKKPKGSKAE